MELELRKINIKDVQLGKTTRVFENILQINKEEIIRLLKEDRRIKDVKIDLAKPGESVRIVPVKDIIEPRAKLEGEAFPGVDGEMKEVGRGITYALKGCAVVTTGPIVGFQEGIIDMCGPLTQYTPFSYLNNIVIHIIKEDEVPPHEHEEAVRIVGVKAAHFIANQDPNRVVPVDVLKKLERGGEIGSLYEYFISTTGNSTSVADATRMGEEIAQELANNGVEGVILTST